ncbi:MAG: adenylate/guanylate cyclase domain-containing protein [Actinomycetota bacterium]|nr:adenylate/guanylate cyclase domain-containing protein [Actinomycetota bacterium]
MSQVLEQSPLEAGRDAIERHAWHEAYELLSAADAAEPLGPEDLESLAQSAWWTGRLEQCISARERAYASYLQRNNPRRAAVVALDVSHDYFGKLAHSIGAGWFNRAERLLEAEDDCAEKGYLAMQHGLGLMAAGDLDGGLEAAKATLDFGTRFGDRDLQAYGLLLEGKALVSKGEVTEGLALLDEATVAAVSGEIGPLASGIIYCIAIAATAALADYQRAGEWTEASRRWCERQSISGFPGICRVHRAEIIRLRGSWAEAEQEARRALNELQNFNLEFAGFGFYEIGEVRLRMGDLEEAKDAFKQAHELGHNPQPGLALLYLAEGKADAAAQAIQRAVDDPSFDRLGRFRLLTPQVTIAIAAGDLETARAAAEEAELIAAEFESPVLQASALLARGELQLAEGDPGSAVLNCRKSWRDWREADLPYEAARARMVLGVALRADGDEDGAELELRAARKTFEKLGAVLDLRRAMELLGEDVAEELPKAAMPGERVTKTFMFTDIVSSTTLVEAMGDRAWESLLAWHDQTLRGLFTAHCGEEVKQIGDGFFVAFDDPFDAVECAVDIQRRLAEHRKEHGFAPQVRIGLHSVEATRKGKDYGGRGVHEAARIGALAGAGEILASSEVIGAARTRFPVGEGRKMELKGVSEPVAVASIDPGIEAMT